MATTEIEKLMAATGLQVQEICAALDLPSATLNRYKRGLGTMPPEKLEQLRKLAGGARPALRPLGTSKANTAALVADLPATVLIEELARRARAGRIVEPGAGSLDARRSLRAVAFTDVADD
jgi:hypothetical protein